MFRIRLAAVTAIAAAIAVTACSSSPAPRSSSGPAASGAAHPSAATTTRQAALACAGLVPFDQSVLTYPGGDSGSTPSAGQLRSWAATTTPRLQVLAANVPVSLDQDVATVRAMLTKISNGRPVSSTSANTPARSTIPAARAGRSGPARARRYQRKALQPPLTPATTEVSMTFLDCLGHLPGLALPACHSLRGCPADVIAAHP